MNKEDFIIIGLIIVIFLTACVAAAFNNNISISASTPIISEQN